MWRVAALFLLACEAAPPAHQASDALTSCAKFSGALHSIGDAVARLNALPLPVETPCFIATLPRPLAIVATTGITSAQPANGKENPRIFLMLDGVSIGVVPSGDGAKLLEFGEWVTATRTLKGELSVPVVAPLAADAPFKHVLFSQPATTCALCHRGEAPHDSIPGAYVSVAYRPEPRTLISATALAAEHAACVDDSPRCDFFHALFDFGEVTQGAFAPEVETFVQ